MTREIKYQIKGTDDHSDSTILLVPISSAPKSVVICTGSGKISPERSICVDFNMILVVINLLGMRLLIYNLQTS